MVHSREGGEEGDVARGNMIVYQRPEEARLLQVRGVRIRIRQRMTPLSRDTAPAPWSTSRARWRESSPGPTSASWWAVCPSDRTHNTWVGV